MHAFPSRHLPGPSSSSPSPISKLPTELLSEIFTLCVQHAYAATGTSNPEEELETHTPPAINSDTVRVPLTLASVSCRWRAIVHGQSNLWTSLCISPELITEEMQGKTMIDPTHIHSCLRRSRQSSLNILIDARDAHWNFMEEGVGETVGAVSKPPLFSSEHMKTVISLLIPAISRWQSLSILTDTWAPMHAALCMINAALATNGAPRLESLTLMRCNDFVSFSPRFQPMDLKDVGFLSLPRPGSEYPYGILPSLKHLSLRGVHADWDILGCALHSPIHKLESLELASHCGDVRPSVEQFHSLLSSVAPSLKKLRICGSGPNISNDAEDLSAAPQAVMRENDPVQLPQLQNISIGYRSSLEGRTVLRMLDAPNARKLLLEDATYPGDLDEVNGGSLLTYLGSKHFSSSSSTMDRLSPPVRIAVASDYAQGHHLHYDTTSYPWLLHLPEDDDHTSKATCPHSSSSRKSSSASLRDSDEPHAAFPLLQKVTLKGVKSSPRPLRTFFSALHQLQHLELVEMSMQAVLALVPLSINTGSSAKPTTAAAASSCPCPHLRSLCIRDSGHRVQVNDVDLLRYVTIQRETNGACELQELAFHLDPMRAASIAAAVTCDSPLSPTTKVNVYGDSESEEEDDYEEEEEDMDPFSPGGAFNDPEFDAYYANL
ncbi:hypothetical protein D9613_012327 [Agrocybe pediades]|uniref:F-box domain-containing protein n=1 Tax=Agrocybe pediades TaxID=84607 RepID=A0A8H4QEM0_9AGAR|nr:hypothetical protein D9613_012327 [Agrocybe pediades]